MKERGHRIFLEFYVLFIIKSAKQNSYRMDIFIATKIKSTYNKNIFSEFYKRIRSGWEISESDEKM